MGNGRSEGNPISRSFLDGDEGWKEKAHEWRERESDNKSSLPIDRRKRRRNWVPLMNIPSLPTLIEINSKFTLKL